MKNHISRKIIAFFLILILSFSFSLYVFAEPVKTGVTDFAFSVIWKCGDTAACEITLADERISFPLTYDAFERLSMDGVELSSEQYAADKTADGNVRVTFAPDWLHTLTAGRYMLKAAFSNAEIKLHLYVIPEETAELQNVSFPLKRGENGAAYAMIPATPTQDKNVKLYPACFDRLYLGDDVVDPAQYSVSNSLGYTCIMLHGAYLAALGEGAYTFRADYLNATGVELTITLPMAENLYGDLDGSGSVTAEDARLALRAAVALEPYSQDTVLVGDADGDGLLTASDARQILRLAVKLVDQEHFKEAI